MNIQFTPLAESHFPLLLKWLETPHVKAWWDPDMKWTPALIQKKYADYVKGYRVENGVAKAIHAYIICVDDTAIGYIQIYNAHDFARSRPLMGLPLSLAAFDVFIGEEDYLKQGIGSQAIAQFLQEYGRSYTHIFADPNRDNLAAIRAYEKAGFKKINVQPVPTEVWMMREQMRRPPPLQTIEKLIQERYPEAKTVFWAGSLSQNQGTSASDLDLVIIFDAVPTAYREAFIYDEWPIDAFIHDEGTLRYFFEESRTGNGISGIISMILNGQEVTEPNTLSKSIQALAEEVLKAGPVAWDQAQIDKERFLITDALDDIQCPASRDEQIASAAWLFEALGRFYFRSQKKWYASGKSLIRYLKNDKPDLAVAFTEAFESLFQTGNSTCLTSLVKKILAPYGGLFWNGFKSEAPKESKMEEQMMNIHFEKANPSHIDIIFGWLKETYVQEFWDNTQGHKDDILNFINGRIEPSSYADGKYVYWIASCDDHPFAMLMTIQETAEDHIDDIKLNHLSKTGHTYGIDYMIGDKNYFGKGYGTKALIDFLGFFRKEFDPKADTFLIDPASDNPRAKHVYMKAGFEHIADFVMSGDVSGAGKPHHLLIKRFALNKVS